MVILIHVEIPLRLFLVCRSTTTNTATPTAIKSITGMTIAARKSKQCKLIIRYWIYNVYLVNNLCEL